MCKELNAGLREEENDGIMASLQICSVPGMKEQIMDGLNTEVYDCLPEDEVEW